MVEEDNDGNGDGHEDDRRGPPTTRARCQARRSRRRAATCGDRVGKTQTGSLCRREPRPSHATYRVRRPIRFFREVELAVEAAEVVDEARPLVYPE